MSQFQEAALALDNARVSNCSFLASSCSDFFTGVISLEIPIIPRTLPVSSRQGYLLVSSDRVFAEKSICSSKDIILFSVITWRSTSKIALAISEPNKVRSSRPNISSTVIPSQLAAD